MREHSLLECAFVDAAFSDDKDLVGRVAKLLFDNMEAQADMYGTMFAGFPKEEFKALLGQHVSFFAEQTGHLMERSVQRAERSGIHLMENSVALAALTSEWF